MVSTFIKNQVKVAFVFGALFLSGNSFAQLNLNWSEMGPDDIAGRTRSIMISNADATKKTVYCGGVSGGVFKSTNSGANWMPVNDQSASLIVSSLAQTNNGSTIYFGTGETFGRGGDGAGSSGFIGTGLYQFTSSSNVITLVKDSSVFGNINEIAVNSANHIYVASQKGLFFSTDGGATFTEEDTSFVKGVPAMDVKISASGDVYYSAGSKDLATNKVYVKLASSANFTNITPTVISNRGRIEIATAPSDANYVYLSIAKQKTATASTGGLSAVLVSNTKGASWSIISLGTAQFDPFLEMTTGYGDYSNTIAVDPNTAKSIYLGGEVFYGWSQITTNPLGQGTWYQIGTTAPIPFAAYIHSKVHAITFDATSMFLATDGGVFKSVSGNSGFLPYNKGLNISQFNSVSFPIYPRVNAGTSTNVAVPYAGVAGGSIGNSLTYLPGYYNDPNNGPKTSKSFGYTNAFQSDFSRISPKASFYAGAYGSIFRTNDIDAAPYSTFYDQSYKGGGPGGPGANTFANENTAMRLWENYNNTDSAIFINESATTSFNNTDPTGTRFFVKNINTQGDHRYEKITITTVSNKLIAPPTNQTITIVPYYNGPKQITSYNVTGDANTTFTTNNMIVLSTSSVSLSDSIKFEFLAPPQDSAVITVAMDLSFKTKDTVSWVSSTINKSSTATSFKVITARAKPEYRYEKIVVSTISTKLIAPPASQTITINIGAYNTKGDSIPVASQAVSGQANTTSPFNNLLVVNNAKKDTVITTYNQDTLRLTFLSAPDSCKFAITSYYITNDSIVLKNTDISGGNFLTGMPITNYLSTGSGSQFYKIPLRNSARLAVGLANTTTATGPSVYVTKKPLNFSINPDWVKIAGKFSRYDSLGIPTKNFAPILGTVVTRLEWAPSGKTIYFSTKLNDSTFYLYRISHLEFIGDSSAADYSGMYASDVDKSATVANLNAKQRTTPIGRFKYPITGIAISESDTMLMITTGGYKNKMGTVYYSNFSAAKMDSNKTNTSFFTIKNGSTLPFTPAYTGILEMSDNKKAIVGTENGIYSTLDITANPPTWTQETGGNFPNVPVFQIRQQTYPSYKCYNSGVIYAATHGRGIWSTDKFATPYAIGIDEKEETSLYSFNSNIRLFPNPASDAANLWFKANGDASYVITVYDINGRTLIQNKTPKLMEGEQVVPLNTAELNAGVYFISVNGSNNFNATTKMVITR